MIWLNINHGLNGHKKTEFHIMTEIKSSIQQKVYSAKINFQKCS